MSCRGAKLSFSFPPSLFPLNWTNRVYFLFEFCGKNVIFYFPTELILLSYLIKPLFFCFFFYYFHYNGYGKYFKARTFSDVALVGTPDLANGYVWIKKDVFLLSICDYNVETFKLSSVNYLIVKFTLGNIFEAWNNLFNVTKYGKNEQQKQTKRSWKK